MSIFFFFFCVFFFNDTATTEIYTLSLHDALPICKCQKTNLIWKLILRRKHEEFWFHLGGILRFDLIKVTFFSCIGNISKSVNRIYSCSILFQLYAEKWHQLCPSFFDDCLQSHVCPFQAICYERRVYCVEWVKKVVFFPPDCLTKAMDHQTTREWQNEII